MKDLKIFSKIIMAVVCGFAVFEIGKACLFTENDIKEVNAVDFTTAPVETELYSAQVAPIEQAVVVKTEEMIAEFVTIEDEESPEAPAPKDVYANVEGDYLENITDKATGIKYNMWMPKSGSENKPVIFCVTGISNWASESAGYGPHLVLKNHQITPDAVIVVLQRKTSGAITKSYTKANLTTFIKKSIIETFHTSTEDVYYYGFSMGGVDFNVFGPLYNWKAAAFSDGYNSAMCASNYCKSLKAVMYNNSTGTPSSWNKKNADKSAEALGLVEGETYIWNMVNGSHANVNQYAVISTEGQGHPSFSKKCTWKVNECDGMPRALNWLLQW